MGDKNARTASARGGPPAAVREPARTVASGDARQAARDAAECLSRALERERFAGWDPWDALSSPFLRALARGRLPRLVVTNAVKRSPLNLRPLVGIPVRRHTKALALLASAYTRLAEADVEPRSGHLAHELADALAERAVAVGGAVGWGYDFDVQTRWSSYAAGQPNAVVTTYGAHALLDVGGYERLVGAVEEFALSRLLVEARGDRYFAYFEGSRTPIHNANLLVVGLFARIAKPGDRAWRIAGDAVAYSLARQRADGSWPYGEGGGLDWVDGYHTAYVLENLGRWHRATGDADALAALERGLDLYLARLIDPDGGPRATLESRYPLDAHAAGSAITALCSLRDYDTRTLPTAERVLAWTLRTMRRRDGRFAFQRGRYLRNSVPYVRWNDAHMLLALASYLTACDDDEAR